jgi:hypothetical protein
VSVVACVGAVISTSVYYMADIHISLLHYLTEPNVLTYMCASTCSSACVCAGVVIGHVFAYNITLRVFM